MNISQSVGQLKYYWACSIAPFTPLCKVVYLLVFVCLFNSISNPSFFPGMGAWSTWWFDYLQTALHPPFATPCVAASVQWLFGDLRHSTIFFSDVSVCYWTNIAATASQTKSSMPEEKLLPCLCYSNKESWFGNTFPQACGLHSTSQQWQFSPLAFPICIPKFHSLPMRHFHVLINRFI